MNNNFIELNNDQLLYLNGGRNWLKIIGGGLVCVGSIMALPEEITIAAGVTCGVALIGGVACIVDGL